MFDVVRLYIVHTNVRTRVRMCVRGGGSIICCFNQIGNTLLTLLDI